MFELKFPNSHLKPTPHKPFLQPYHSPSIWENLSAGNATRRASEIKLCKQLTPQYIAIYDDYNLSHFGNISGFRTSATPAPQTVYRQTTRRYYPLQTVGVWLARLGQTP